MKHIYKFILALVFLCGGASDAQAGGTIGLGIKKSNEYIMFPLTCEDSAGIDAKPDSAHVFSRLNDATANSMNRRNTVYPFIGANPNILGIDTSKVYGDTTYWYSNKIFDIDGSPSEPTYTLTIDVVLYCDAGLANHNKAIVQVIADSLNESTVDAIATLVKLAYFDTLIYLGPHGLGVYIDSAASNTNTVVGTDGTHKNPVSTLVAARTVADALGTETYYIINMSTFNGATVDLSATHSNWEFYGIGHGAEMAFGSQLVTGSHFDNIVLSGAMHASGGDVYYTNCEFGYVSANFAGHADHCLLTDTIVLKTGRDVEFIDCASGVTGNHTPTIDFSSASSTADIRHYSGGIRFMNASSNDTISIELDGQIIVSANNTSLKLTARGMATLTDSGTTTVITKDALFSRREADLWVWANVDTALTVDTSEIGIWLSTGAGVAAATSDTSNIKILFNNNPMLANTPEMSQINLVRNPGFERDSATAGTAPEFWTQGGGTHTLDLSKTSGMGGRWEFFIDPSANETSFVYQYVGYLEAGSYWLGGTIDGFTSIDTAAWIVVDNVAPTTVSGHIDSVGYDTTVAAEVGKVVILPTGNTYIGLRVDNGILGWEAEFDNIKLIPLGFDSSVYQGSAAGLDSGTISRVVHRVAWGTPQGSGSDSSTLAERDATVAAMDADVVTASAIAAAAIGSSELATNAIGVAQWNATTELLDSLFTTRVDADTATNSYFGSLLNDLTKIRDSIQFLITSSGDTGFAADEALDSIKLYDTRFDSLLAAASDVAKGAIGDSVLLKDTVDAFAVLGSFGKFVKDSAVGGGGGSDTTSIKAMLANNQLGTGATYSDWPDSVKSYVDDTLTAAHGSGAWTSGALSGGGFTVALGAVDTTGTDSLVSFVDIDFFTLAGTFLGRIATNSDGYIPLGIDSGKYLVRSAQPFAQNHFWPLHDGGFDTVHFFANGDTIPSALDVAATDSAVTGFDLDPGTPSVANTCVVTLYLGDIDGITDNEDLFGRKVTFTLPGQHIDTCASPVTVITNVSKTGTSDINGIVQVQLRYSSCLQETAYELTIDHPNYTDKTFTITVPNQATYTLTADDLKDD